MDIRALEFVNFEVPPAYCEEPRGQFKANWMAIAKPSNDDEVALLIEIANAQGIAIVPYGGGTGLVGGQIYDGEGDAICLSLEKFKSIEIFDDYVIVGAGVVLDELHEALSQTDFHFPLSLASSGSAQIGGLISTNAGGINAVRFGTMADLTMGVRGFFGDGRRVDATHDLRKDNTGYRVDRLLIGSEGSLGIITRAKLKIVKRDAVLSTVLASIESPEAAYEILRILKAQAAPVNAFELISKTTLQLREEAGFEPAPIGMPEWSLLVELAGETESLEPVFEFFGETAFASNESQRDKLWQLRETIPLANRKMGRIVSHDIALEPSLVATYIRTMPSLLAAVDDVRINCFGHMGDGNLHYNIFPAIGRARSDYDKAAISKVVYDQVCALGGSISAEHGIGRLKAQEMRHYGMGEKLDIMRDIKSALDPNGIINPGVYE